VLTGWILFRWRLHEAVDRLSRAVGPGYFVSLVLGAIPGAWLTGSFNTLNAPVASLSHSVVGALAGAIVGVEVYKVRRGISGSTGGVFVGPFTVGLVIGRWGCLFAGLDDQTYGIPTQLPWGVDLGDGISRHPVQVYESLAMAGFMLVYLIGLGRRSPWAYRRSFYAMVAFYGVQRFVWEFLKPYPSVIGPFNIFHLISGGVALYGFICFGRDLRRQHVAADRALSVLRTDHESV
jgi:hypothetical protein